MFLIIRACICRDSSAQPDGATVKRVADAVELSLVIFGLVSADALDDGGGLGAAEAAECLDDALLVTVAPGSCWPG